MPVVQELNLLLASNENEFSALVAQATPPLSPLTPLGLTRRAAHPPSPHQARAALDAIAAQLGAFFTEALGAPEVR